VSPSRHNTKHKSLFLGLALLKRRFTVEQVCIAWLVARCSFPLIVFALVFVFVSSFNVVVLFVPEGL
jgi:hypothetical protein